MTFEYVGVSPVTDTVRTNLTRSQDSVEVYQVSVCSVRCVPHVRVHVVLCGWGQFGLA